MTGADVAQLLRFVQRLLRWRGLRAPVGSLGGFEVCAPALLAHIRQASLGRRDLARVSVVLSTLASYYSEIGSSFDARRMRDMREMVDLVSNGMAFGRSGRLSPRSGATEYAGASSKSRRAPMSEARWQAYDAARRLPTREARVAAISALLNGEQ